MSVFSENNNLFVSLPVSSAPFFPLSASYPYDLKTSFNPTLFQYSEGYSFIHHPLFKNIKDIKSGKDTLFHLTTARSLGDLVNDLRSINSTDLVLYTGLKANNNKYVRSVGINLFANGDLLDSSGFFRISKNIDNTFKVAQGSLVFTVNRFSPWDITLQEELLDDTYNTQKFYVYNTENGLTLQTLFEAPWWSDYSIPPRYLNRFISYSSESEIQAIGLTKDDDYKTTHNYVFEASSDIGLFILGYDGLLKWVKYYNEIDGKFFNKTVDIKEIVDNVLCNYLVDVPYKTTITQDSNTDNLKLGTFNINMLNLKNIMSPEYTYGYSSKTYSFVDSVSS